MNINYCKYVNILVVEIMAVVTNEYYKIMKSDFHEFVENSGMDNNIEEKLIKIYKTKRFDSYFCYFLIDKCKFLYKSTT